MSEDIGYWDKATQEWVARLATGRDVRLPYICTNTYSFRASELHDFVWAYRISDTLMSSQQAATMDDTGTKDDLKGAKKGTMLASEVRTCLTRLGEDPTDKELLKIVNSADPYPSGIITFQKFVQIMTHFDRSMLTERELLDAFLGFDRHRNDSIDAIELANVIERLGFEIHPLEAHAMIQEVDTSGTGVVPYKALVASILKNQ